LADRALARRLPAIVYTPALTDFDLGGIVSTHDRRYLLAAQGTTGQLWRIDLRTLAIAEVELGGVRLINADGIVLRGRTLWVVQMADGARVDVHVAAGGSRLIRRRTRA
jgi:hypothetical protein